jgi:hypothetical protein
MGGIGPPPGSFGAVDAVNHPFAGRASRVRFELPKLPGSTVSSPRAPAGASADSTSGRPPPSTKPRESCEGTSLRRSVQGGWGTEESSNGAAVPQCAAPCCDRTLSSGLGIAHHRKARCSSRSPSALVAAARLPENLRGSRPRSARRRDLMILSNDCPLKNGPERRRQRMAADRVHGVARRRCHDGGHAATTAPGQANGTTGALEEVLS